MNGLKIMKKRQMTHFFEKKLLNNSLLTSISSVITKLCSRARGKDISLSL